MTGKEALSAFPKAECHQFAWPFKGTILARVKNQNYLNYNFRGIHDEKKMFFRRTIVIRYVLNHIALFVCAFLVAIFSLEFGLAMSQNITILLAEIRNNNKN